MNEAEAFINGRVLLLDKPLHWTSFQLVNKVRWEIKQKFKIKKIKVGHAGTLDPLATGLLIICTGKQTKQIDQYQAQEKEYTGTFELGSTTPSFDLETEIDQTFDTSHLTDEMIKNATHQFIGDITQLPPVFSAVKKDGKRLYEFARAGETVELKPRQVSISEFEITKIESLTVHFRVVCSKGTYIRSLADDFGKALDCGAHLSSLRRTRIGNFKIENTQTLEEFLAGLE
jgi:tRNA pseudouridine55 synthase